MANNYSGKSIAELQALSKKYKGNLADRGGADVAKASAAKLAAVQQALEAQRAKATKNNTNKAKVPSQYKTPFSAADAEVQRQDKLNNPNQQNPYGNREIVTDKYGNKTIKDTLSQNQQGILGSDELLSKAGRDLSYQQLAEGNFGTSFTPQTSSRSMGADFMADRNRIEDAIYSKFTRGIDDKEKADRAELEAQLRNQGITYSDDPKSQYQMRMKDLNTRYDTARENARQTSIQEGGNEYKTDFGIQEQRIANEYSQGLGTHQQRWNDIQNLSNLGGGPRDPNFQSYAPAGYDPATWAALSEQEKQRIQQMAIAKMQNATNRAQIDASTQPTSAGNPAFPQGGL